MTEPEDENDFENTTKYPTLRMKLKHLAAHTPMMPNESVQALIALLLEDLPEAYLDSSGAALASYRRTHNG